jgi:hypothetical protein
VSRGELGYDATAVYARARAPRGREWALALAEKSEIRLYEPLWSGARADAGATTRRRIEVRSIQK